MINKSSFRDRRAKLFTHYTVTAFLPKTPFYKTEDTKMRIKWSFAYARRIIYFFEEDSKIFGILGRSMIKIEFRRFLLRLLRST